MGITVSPARGGQYPTQLSRQLDTGDQGAQAHPLAAPAVAAESAPVETPASVTEEAKAPSDEALSPKYAALAKRERALRSKVEETKRKEAELAQKAAEYEQNYVSRERLKEDPLGILLAEGFTPEDLANAILNQPTQVKDPRVEKLEAELAELKKSRNEEKQTAYERALSQIKADAEVLINQNAAFETIKEMGQVDAVVALIEETFKADGTMLSVHEAAEEVEKYLVDEAIRMANLKKVQERLKPKEEVLVQQAEQTQIPNKQSTPPMMKTLTNAATATSSRPLTAKERRERAILAFRGELQPS